jgi:hypothetical protein
MTVDGLLKQYLGRLEAASQPLAADRRAELLNEVREHIEAALADSGARDEVTVRNVLDRLGAPEEIVAAEAQNTAPPSGGLASATTVIANPRVGAIEVIALVLLVAGGWLIPLVGSLLGLIFVWMSVRWNQRDKLIATVVVLVGPLISVLLLFDVRAGS